MIISKISVFVFAIAFGACGSNEAPTVDLPPENDNTQPTDVTPTPEPAGIMKSTQDAYYRVWLDIPEPFAVGLVKNLDLTVRNTDGLPVSGLTISVMFIHKEMGHGGSKIPFVEEVGDGKYVIKNVAASMRGLWSLSLDIVEEAVTDLVAYDIAIS